MELLKKRYCREEVEGLLNASGAEFSNRLEYQKQIIAELSEKNADLQRQLDFYLGKDDLIAAAIKTATQKSQETQKEVDVLYQIECERLQNFCDKLKAFCDKNLKFSQNAGKVKDINDKMQCVLSSDISCAEKINQAESVLDNRAIEKQKSIEIFNPQKIINEYIACSSGGGFDMDEILNPKDVNLEEVCNQMGLTKRK